MTHYKISGSNLTENSKLLHDFFLAEENKPKNERKKHFHVGESYPFGNDTIEFAVEVTRNTQDIKTWWWWPFPLRKYVYTFYTKKNVLGEGSYGTVYDDVIAQYQHGENHLEMLTYQPLVIKIQTVTSDSPDIAHKREMRKFNEVYPNNNRSISFEKNAGERVTSYSVQMKIPGNSEQEVDDNVKTKDPGEAELAVDTLNRLNLAERKKLTINLIRALINVDAVKIIQRDFKPANILVDANLNVSILDFGISRWKYIKDNKSLGTPSWASPEIINTPLIADEKSDVYSLGLFLRCLWEDQVWLKDLKRYEGCNALQILAEKQNPNYLGLDTIKISTSMQKQLCDNGIDPIQLEKILSKMTSTNHNVRLDAYSALDEFEFLFKRKSKYEPLKKDIYVGLAFGIGIVAAVTVIALTWGAALPVIAGAGAIVGGLFTLSGAASIGVGLATIGVACVGICTGLACLLGAKLQNSATSAVVREKFLERMNNSKENVTAKKPIAPSTSSSNVHAQPARPSSLTSIHGTFSKPTNHGNYQPTGNQPNKLGMKRSAT